MSGEFLSIAVYRWARNLQRTGDRLRAQMIVDAWIDGLNRSGTAAARAKTWTRGTRGSYPKELPFVIEFECPYAHRTEDRRRLAMVRLIVEDDGWVTLDDESTCPECDHTALETWLLTCPRCEVGEESVWHRPGHEPDHRYVRVKDVPEPGYFGSTSPFSFILAEFERMARLAEATWWAEHTKQAVESFRAETGISSIDETDPYLRDRIKGAMKMVEAARARTTRASSRHSRKAWSSSQVVDWLDAQKTMDGEAAIPVGATQRDAWKTSEGIGGHPPKNLIEQAQSVRKSRGNVT